MEVDKKGENISLERCVNEHRVAIARIILVSRLRLEAGHGLNVCYFELPRIEASLVSKSSKVSIRRGGEIGGRH